RWVLFALINGEELGVKAKTADDMKANDPRPELRRLLGAEGSFGTDMGLDNDWALRALKAVGNYGEVFERNLGKATLLGIARGLNAAWNDGGILYAPPVR
ncbi:MAG: amino acid ABC transporter substrate-binding protein, partial [Alphaproteobacteria bacterium]|nr:amino acid ABC transporter substrate-binding protein [Alphaproteobacteria bacterium]